MKTRDNRLAAIARQLDDARALLRSGDPDGAEKMLSAVHSRNRKDPEVLGLLATTVFLRGDRGFAKKLWKQSLEDSRRPVIFFANLHAFLRALLMENNQEAAARQAARMIPSWPVSQVPNAGERKILIELAEMLVVLGRREAARELMAGMAKAVPRDPEVGVALGQMQMFVGNFAAALATLRRVDEGRQSQTDLDLLVKMYQCANRLNDRELKVSLIQRAMAAYPVHIAPRQAGQQKEVLIISDTPRLENPIKSKGDFFVQGNYPAQIIKKFAGDYHFSSIFLYSETAWQAKTSLPSPDLIINNNANADTLTEKRHVPALVEFIDGFGVPVINHPQKVVATTRAGVARLLDGIPGILMPRTLRFSKSGKSTDELIAEIEAVFDYPLITRTLSAQQGQGMTKIDNGGALAEILPSVPEDFYTTQFVDSRGGSPYYRKIRAAIVGDEIVVVRVDYDTYWNIHGRKSEDRVKFYQDHPETLVSEDRICTDPDTEFGVPVMERLREIRQHIPLDVFGVDFDVAASGELVVYEANATMNLLSTAHSEVPHPAHAEERLMAALHRYLKCVAG